MGSCLSFFSVFDFYDIPMRILFNYSSNFHSLFGAIVSLIVYIITIFILIFLLVFLLQKKEENISTFEEKYVIPPMYNISFYNDEIKYSKSDDYQVFFLPSFSFYDNDSLVPLEQIVDNISLTIKKKILYADDDEKETFFTLGNCNDIFNSSIGKYSELLHTKSFQENYSYCLNLTDTSNITLKGDYSHRPYEYMQIKFQLRDGKNFTAIQNIKIVFSYPSYSLTDNKPNEAPIIYSYKKFEVNFLKETKEIIDFYVSLDEFTSRDNLFADWSKTNKIRLARLNKINKNFQKLTSKEKTTDSITFIIRSESNYKRYLRSYKTFFSFLSQIGGFWKVLFLIGLGLCSGFTKFMMNIDISNKMFNMIHPDNKEITYSFEHYDGREKEFGDSAPLFKSVNPLLKKEVYNYYKYERNKGLNFTAKEFFSKICCCCITKGNIYKKEEIFRKSSEDIEHRLEMSTIGEFSFQSKLLRRIVLQDDEVMTGYRAYNNINYDHLFEIVRTFNQEKEIQKSSILCQTFEKQKNFIRGMTGIRNQGSLSKIDRNTIDLLECDQEFLKKYFGHYYKNE